MRELILWIHVIAGSVTLLTGPMAIFFNFRDPKRHKVVGKIFFYAMLLVCFSSLGGYFMHPGQVFYLFLLGISVLVLGGTLRGVRAMMLMRGAAVNVLDYLHNIMMPLNGLWMLGMALRLSQKEGMLAFVILFSVFGLGAFSELRRSWQALRYPETLTRMTWMRIHSSNMVGAFIASTTAFTVNTAHYLPWYIQWFGPTLLLVPVQVYFGRKLKRSV